jgi:hypothetical protein
VPAYGGISSRIYLNETWCPWFRPDAHFSRKDGIRGSSVLLQPRPGLPPQATHCPYGKHMRPDCGRRLGQGLARRATGRACEKGPYRRHCMSIATQDASDLSERLLLKDAAPKPQEQSE